LSLLFFPRRLRNENHSLRGHQIAEYLGAPVNPAVVNKDDVCIYVKMRPIHGAISYIDMVDNSRYIDVLKNHPEFNGIAVSQTALDFIKSQVNNKVVFIPHHHCNYERARRQRSEVLTVGYIGEDVTFDAYRWQVVLLMEKRGINFVYCHDYNTRQDVCDFYKKIDIQIVWRDITNTHGNGRDWGRWVIPELKNPLKLSNAGSFGIPTVAFPEINFEAEYKGAYLPAATLDELVDQIDLLKNNPAAYDYIARKAEANAEKYHVENIAKLYRTLD
jgi:hypothetical protein